MGRRGPAPKPTALLELSGRSHKKKQPPLKTLDIDASIPDDYDIIPSAKELWLSLSKAGIVKQSDRLAFMRMANLMTIYAKAAEDVRVRGLLLKKDTADERYNPSWRIMRDAHIEILKIEMQYGLTPSSKRFIMQPLETDADKGGDAYAETRLQQREARKASTT